MDDRNLGEPLHQSLMALPSGDMKVNLLFSGHLGNRHLSGPPRRYV